MTLKNVIPVYMEKMEIYSSDMKVPYFVFRWCHPRAGGDPTQLSEINQLFYGFPPQQGMTPLGGEIYTFKSNE